MSDALSLAVQLLARREHTAEELRQKLAQRGWQRAEVEAALHHLQQRNLQSDQRFCAAYLREKQGSYGDFRLRAELARRGVDEEVTTAALKAAALPPEAQRAAALLQRKYPRGVAAGDEKTEQTARRFLHNRGFGGESIRAALVGLANLADLANCQ